MTLTKEKINTHTQRKLLNDECPVKVSNANEHEMHFRRISTAAKKCNSFLMLWPMQHSCDRSLTLSISSKHFPSHCESFVLLSRIWRKKNAIDFFYPDLPSNGYSQNLPALAPFNCVEDNCLLKVFLSSSTIDSSADRTSDKSESVNAMTSCCHCRYSWGFERATSSKLPWNVISPLFMTMIWNDGGDNVKQWWWPTVWVKIKYPKCLIFFSGKSG